VKRSSSTVWTQSMMLAIGHRRKNARGDNI
jgi:hypothetical protein